MAYPARELLAQYAGAYPDGPLRTLQRRLKECRLLAAHRMVFGTNITDLDIARNGAGCSVGTIVSAIVKAARKALWICRCAWTTLARRPQLHPSPNTKPWSRLTFSSARVRMSRRRVRSKPAAALSSKSGTVPSILGLSKRSATSSTVGFSPRSILFSIA